MFCINFILQHQLMRISCVMVIILSMISQMAVSFIPSDKNALLVLHC